MTVLVEVDVWLTVSVVQVEDGAAAVAVAPLCPVPTAEYPRSVQQQG